MNILILRAKTDPAIDPGWAPEHRIAVFNVPSDLPSPATTRSADWIFAFPSAAKALRLKSNKSTREFLSDVVVAIAGRTIVTSTFQGPSTGSPGPDDRAYPLSSNSILKLHHHPDDLGFIHPTNKLFYPLLSYLKRHAKCSVERSAAWLPFLPFTLPLAVRSAMYHGGVELVLPLEPHAWDIEAFRSHLKIAAYYQTASMTPHHPVWARRLRFFRNGDDHGLISEDERAHFHDNFNDCVSDVIDASKPEIIRHRSEDKFYRCFLAAKEMYAILELFHHLRTPSACENEESRYFESDGTPVRYDSASSRRRQVNSAVQKINAPVGLPDLVTRVHGTKPRQLIVEPGERIVALIISDTIIESSKSLAGQQFAYQI